MIEGILQIYYFAYILGSNLIENRRSRRCNLPLEYPGEFSNLKLPNELSWIIIFILQFHPNTSSIIHINHLNQRWSYLSACRVSVCGSAWMSNRDESLSEKNTTPFLPAIAEVKLNIWNICRMDWAGIEIRLNWGAHNATRI